MYNLIRTRVHIININILNLTSGAASSQLWVWWPWRDKGLVYYYFYTRKSRYLLSSILTQLIHYSSHYVVPAATGHQNHVVFTVRCPSQGERNLFVTFGSSPSKIIASTLNYVSLSKALQKGRPTDECDLFRKVEITTAARCRTNCW